MKAAARMDIKEGDVVEVVSNEGSPWLDEIIGSVGAVSAVHSEESEEPVYELREIPHLQFSRGELRPVCGPAGLAKRIFRNKNSKQ
jgi:hypothetical protein